MEVLFFISFLLQDSDDEDGDEGEDAEEGVSVKLSSPVHEEQSEPEMTEEEREFQLVSPTCTCSRIVLQLEL